jgi:hypothetical protein
MYNAIPQDELFNNYPKPEQSIRITLQDGSVIESPEYAHILTDKPMSLIVGVGQVRSQSTPFKGMILASELDSAKEVSTTEGVSLVCWLKNNTSLRFKEGEYLVLTSHDPPGFWCAGRRTTPVGTTHFKGMLARDQVGGFEVRELDYQTIAWIIGPVAVLWVVIRSISWGSPTSAGCCSSCSPVGNRRSGLFQHAT